MLTLQWKPMLEVGIELMDQDHRAMIELLGSVSDANDRGDPSAVLAALERLCSYSERHFEREEALMRQVHYEFTGEHRRQHRKLIRQLKRLLSKLARGSTIPDEIVTFMQRWLLAHIAGADRHLGQAIVSARHH